MKKSAYLKDENLLTLLSLHNFVVPEIQREYVWGNELNKDEVLRPFLESLKTSANIESCRHAHSRSDVHIGFLYSYNPLYLRDTQNSILDENLIDGQQRYTTLFLLLLTRAVYEKRMSDFLNIIRWDDKSIAFDYKVRNLTHMFIRQLIGSVKEKNGDIVLDNIIKGDYPNWLMRDYQDDVSVKAMIGTLATIQEVFENSDDQYFDYLLSRIRFWHFKTDVTSQGEELYITMNSRGEELSGNESTKAKIFLRADQTIWGPKWELWQTFFWRNRKNADKPNKNADKGFNNFLECCNAMSMQMQMPQNDINNLSLFLESIQYVESTDWISVLQSTSQSAFVDWIADLKKYIWNKINNWNSKWSIDNQKNDTTQEENASLMWPWIYFYYYSKKSNKLIDNNVFVRLLHICYLNAFAKKRKYDCIKSFIEELVDYVPTQNHLSYFEFYHFKDDKYLSEETREFSKIYDNCASSKDAYELEAAIWKVQSEHFFLCAEDVGDYTILYYIKEFQNLIQLNPGLTLKNLVENLYLNISNLFPETALNSNEVAIKRLLLFYEMSGLTSWKRVLPMNNRNYELSVWKRIVREKGFLSLYIDMIALHQYKTFSIQDVKKQMEVKQKDFFVKNSIHQNLSNRCWSDCEIAILYDFLTDGNIWLMSGKPNLTFLDGGGLYSNWPRVYNSEYKKWRSIVLPPNDWQNKLKNSFSVPFVF